MKNHYLLAKEEMSMYGSDCTSLQNILAVLIGPNADSAVTGQLAGLGIKKLSTMSKQELMEFEGIGETSASRIISSFGLASIIKKFVKEDRYVVRSPEDAAKYFSDLEGLSQEHFEAIYLNTKNQVIARKTVFKGSLNASIVHPRELYREGLKVSAAFIIVAHNHPSGSPDPSREDIEVTKRLVEVGKTMGMEILDHVIIGENGHFVSLKEKGYC